MIHRLAQRIAEYCTEDTGTDREIVTYGLECRISDLVQTVVLVAAGLLFDCMPELASFSVCFTLLKRNVGGYHCSTHVSCIGVFSALSILLSRLAARILAGWAVVLSFTGMAVALALVFRRAPIAHPNHPKSPVAHAKSRKASLWLASVGALLLPLVSVPLPAMGVAGALGSLAAASTLAIPIWKERRE